MKLSCFDLKHWSHVTVLLILLQLQPLYASGTPDSLVGRWECRIEYGSWTIQRNADGTFEKRGEIVRTLGQPSTHFVIKGRWRLDGKDYVEVWEHVSPDTWSNLQKSTRRATVLLLRPDEFRRIQRDSPVFVETRIR
jgi:hypothetical protein